MKADLHIHTDESDGRDSIDEVIEESIEKQLDVIAITDHDKPHPKLSQPISDIRDLTVIKGIELRVKSSAGRFDLLGYGVSETKELTKEMRKVIEGRRQRTQSIVNSIESDFDTELDIKIEGVVGRPHIARAIDKNESIKEDYLGAFENLIGDNCKYYEDRYVTDYERGIKLLKQSCEFVSLAHPYRYENVYSIISLCGEVEGIEFYYPYNEDYNLSRLEEYDKIKTGGSDAHKKEDIGKETLNKPQKFLNKLHY